MATTNTLLRDADYIIVRAFRRLKKLSATALPEAHEYVAALEMLQDIMQAWSNPDVSLHRQISVQIPFVQGQPIYDLSVYRALDVHNIQLSYDAGGISSYPLTPMGADDYKQFPTKTQEGGPVQYWFDPSPTSHVPGFVSPNLTPDAANLYVWPVADAGIAVAGFMMVTISVPYQIPQLTTDVLDVPQEWYQMMIYKLAAELFDQFGGNAAVIGKAQMLWDEVLEADRPAWIDLVPRDGF